MAKYNFSRMGPLEFESMVQSLLENTYRKDHGLIQFGAGKDGGREAVFDADGTGGDTVGKCVVQVKYHDADIRGWKVARDSILAELDNELDKVVNKYKHKFVRYILVTNIPFTGVHLVGTRDKCENILKSWRGDIANIDVWDASDLSRMLDADSDTRTAYLDTILPGDVLRAIYEKTTQGNNTLEQTLKTYLISILRSQREAKADEAGDEDGSLPIEKIYVDVSLSLDSNLADVMDFSDRQILGTSQRRHKYPSLFKSVRSSYAFLFATHDHVLIKGGPGVGKSTITQFLTLLHASRILKDDLFDHLLEKIILPKSFDLKKVESCMEVRYPLRIELRRYAVWISEKGVGEQQLARYLVHRINTASSGLVSIDEFFGFASSNPILLMLDGLDEVPNITLRQSIFSELHSFLDRCKGSEVDIQIVLSTRPQGYQGDFENFNPVVWTINDLATEDFDRYANDWLNCRVVDEDERDDARARIKEGMKSPSVSQMAKSLLQATVMLNIARRKQVIPEARHMLFERYVNVIFDREKIKSTKIQTYEAALMKLHEVVGYKLIDRAQYLDKPSVITGVEFGKLLEEVIKEYGKSAGSTYGQINEDKEAIVELSRNRVCLLAGKGDDQENIDFVIQSFREYFAAAYIYRHEQKSSEKAFMALVERHRAWANVFRFYVAFEDASTQKSWLLDAQGWDQSQGDYRNIAMAVRLRHELAAVLPEITELKNNTQITLLKYLLDFKYMWAWSDDALVELGRNLRSFGSGNHFEYLKDNLLPLSSSDEESRERTLLLLANYGFPKYRSELDNIFKDSMKKNLMPVGALRRLVEIGAVVSVSSNYEREFRVSARFIHYKNGIDSERPSISGSDQLNFFFSGFSHRRRNFLNSGSGMVGEIVGLLCSMDVSVQGASTDVRVFPSLFVGKRQIKASLLDNLEGMDSSLADYILALFRAKKNIGNIELYKNALVLEGSADIVDIIDETELSVYKQLGPVYVNENTGVELIIDYKLNKPTVNKICSLLNEVVNSSVIGGFACYIRVDRWGFFEGELSSKVYKDSLAPLQILLLENGINDVQVFEAHVRLKNFESVREYFSFLNQLMVNDALLINNCTLEKKVISDVIGCNGMVEFLLESSTEEIERHIEWLRKTSKYTDIKNIFLSVLLCSDLEVSSLVNLYRNTCESSYIPISILYGRSFTNKITKEMCRDRIVNRFQSAIGVKDLGAILYILSYINFVEPGRVIGADGVSLARFAYDIILDAYDRDSEKSLEVFEVLVKTAPHIDKVDYKLILCDEIFESYKNNMYIVNLVGNAIEAGADCYSDDFACENGMELSRVLPRRSLYPSSMQKSMMCAALKMSEKNATPLKQSDWQD